MSNEGEKKIIIDEDWKTQAQAEKEALEQEKLRKQEGEPEAGAAPGEGPGEGPPGPGEMPPASFGMLLTTLAGEAMVNLGQVPHPLSGQVEINLAVARYFIDTLQILQEKTEGNLSPEESQAVTSVLHELQLAYLSAESHVAATLAEAAAPPPTGE